MKPQHSWPVDGTIGMSPSQRQVADSLYESYCKKALAERSFVLDTPDRICELVRRCVS